MQKLILTLQQRRVANIMLALETVWSVISNTILALAAAVSGKCQKTLCWPKSVTEKLALETPLGNLEAQNFDLMFPMNE